jgi:hypothetical protein
MRIIELSLEEAQVKRQTPAPVELIALAPDVNDPKDQAERW